MKRVLCLLLCVLLLFSGCEWSDTLFPGAAFVEKSGKEPEARYYETGLTVSFIDVGQGDCILISCEGKNMLIDAGENAAESAVADYLEETGIIDFDYVVGTHAHSDHIGSLDYVLAHFRVGKLLLSPQSLDTAAYRSMTQAAQMTDTPIETVMAGDRLTLGGAEISVLGPAKEFEENLNNSSVVLRLVYGNTVFLFTGDMEAEEEKELVESGVSLDADVLKVGHHGSATSSTYLFLREVMPSYGVIQVGEGNEYGHPHEETMSKLNDVRATVYRTDFHGTVMARSNGNQLSFFTQKDAPPVYSTRTLEENGMYIGNSRSMKFHLPGCTELPAEWNTVYFPSREAAVQQGYEPCRVCNP